ncbi:MAG: GTP cyclohydrolase II [Paracoccaceae bacterium]|nr:GTP cyclohydrolase II [Paracoccaceae bacterium]
MSLSPTLPERLARARADMRSGVPVLLDGPDGPGLAAAVETLSEDRLAAMRALGSPVLAITRWRADTLKARAYDGDLARLRLPADATSDWLRCVADPADDLDNPMLGPFRSEREGAALLERAAIALAKAAHLLPAAVVVPVGPDGLSECDGLTRLDASGLAELAAAPPVLDRVVSGRVPMALAEAGRVHIFRPRDGAEEHYAVEVGQPDRAAPVLTRLHSACFTGDVLGSLKCDCGPQLHAALGMIAGSGAGVLLYLNQEGRGIGLANKMRAYALQDQGFDTVDANHRLGFEDDERDFRIGAAILSAMGFAEARLITNNPAKVGMLQANGIAVVERVPIKVGLNPLNEKYLDTKAKKSGHIL